MRVRYSLTFASGLVECLCFAGAVFGWASLVFVLKTEGFFSSLCVNATGVNATQPLGQCHVLTSTAHRYLLALISSEISGTCSYNEMKLYHNDCLDNVFLFFLIMYPQTAADRMNSSLWFSPSPPS